MTPERWQQLETEGAWIDLSGRAKWRLTGSDRVRYLNGQVTNDVRRASDAEAVYACVTDVKGRISGDVQIRASADALWLDAAADLRESLGTRLERYIIADDAELVDVTEDHALWHWIPGKSLPSTIEGVQSLRFGRSGVDLWLAAGEAPDRVSPATMVLTEEETEVLRLMEQVPAFPGELNGETFPPEAGLMERGMDFSKGCYIGQEILSRIKTTGKMPRELRAWRCDGEQDTPRVGESLILGVDGPVVGEITSVGRNPVTDEWIGLAYLRQGKVPVDSQLLVSGDMPKLGLRIEFAPPPEK